MRCRHSSAMGDDVVVQRLVAGLGLRVDHRVAQVDLAGHRLLEQGGGPVEGGGVPLALYPLVFQVLMALDYS